MTIRTHPSGLFDAEEIPEAARVETSPAPDAFFSESEGEAESFFVFLSREFFVPAFAVFSSENAFTEEIS